MLEHLLVEVNPAITGGIADANTAMTGLPGLLRSGIDWAIKAAIWVMGAAIGLIILLAIVKQAADR